MICIAVLIALPSILYGEIEAVVAHLNGYFIWYLLYCVFVAAIISAILSLHKYFSFDRHIKKLGKAARKVAEGDFSEYLPTKQTANEADYINELFHDFNTMVEELGSIEVLKNDFVANVSHELKTPLQSIIGSAELIQNNLVKEEDMPRFIGHIQKEASRLVGLIEDIIRLSELDEEQEIQKEEISLFQITSEVFASLQDAAKKREIVLSLEGTEGRMQGVYRLLYETIYNICDNAIKYNVDGGKVRVSVEDREPEVGIIIEDTGIGIPLEHQSRIFERFYRVDKSHSKKSGGTGLGLSIVKHAVSYHNGSINLNSEEGKGTKIEILFPVER